MQNGMGGAGVALANDDPLSVFFNPAQLGFAARTMNVRQGIYLQKTPWLPTLFRDFNLNAYALQVGYNFSENLSLPLSVGVGFSRQFFDLGETSVRDANNNFVQTIRSYDISNALSVGASLNWRIQVSAGISLKRVSSTSTFFSVQNPPQEVTGNATAVDFGVMAIAPILRRHQLGNKFSTSLDVSLGYSQSNIGGELAYIDEAQADPLPRTARLGYGVSGGIDYELGQARLELVSGAFTAQVTDILVESFGRLRNDGSLESVVEYQVWGDVNLWDNLIRGRAGSGGLSYEQGWRLSFLETFTIMGGVFRQNQTSFTPTSATSGYVVQSRGLFKVIQPYFANSFARFLFEHIDVQYVRSSWNEGIYKDMVFESLNISIVGLRF